MKNVNGGLPKNQMLFTSSERLKCHFLTHKVSASPLTILLNRILDFLLKNKWKISFRRLSSDLIFPENFVKLNFQEQVWKLISNLLKPKNQRKYNFMIKILDNFYISYPTFVFHQRFLPTMATFVFYNQNLKFQVIPWIFCSLHSKP